MYFKERGLSRSKLSGLFFTYSTSNKVKFKPDLNLSFVLERFWKSVIYNIPPRITRIMKYGG